MAKRMLIDATHPEETRVVVLSGNRLEEFDFESSTKKQVKGNIYLAKVTRVEPSLQAAFIEYGGNRHGFLAFSEIHPDYFKIPVADREAGETDWLPPEPASEVSEGAGIALAAALPEPVPVPAALEGGEDDTAETETVGTAVSEQPPVLAEAASISTAPGAEAPAGEPHPEVIPTALPWEDVAPTPPAASEETASARSLFPSDETNPSAETNPEPLPIVEVLPVGFEESVAPGAELAAASSRADYLAAADEPAAPAEAHGAEDGEGSEEEVIETIGGDEIEEAERQRSRTVRHYKIQEVIKRRQIMLVQVSKEERGSKGAALTTYLSLAGRYCVLMPNTARGGGVSRKITSISDRRRLKDILEELDIPEGMGVIVRTAGAERSKAEIKRDYEYLLRLWNEIRDLTLRSTAPALIYEEGNLIKRSIRDLYARDIDEVLVEGEEGYRTAKAFMKMLMPSHAKRVQPYRDPQIGLFHRFQVEGQIDAIHSPIVQLRSGGYIVINQTEALVAIDVNSGRSTRERNIEETAFRTNLEAAEEIARQLRLRDLAGLIVIDFIDMEEHRNQGAVERRLKDALKSDRARIQVGRISPFGLLEMSRQRLRPSLVETSTQPCPHCGGTGFIRSTESTALYVLRSIEEEGMRRRSAEISVAVPTAVALYILNQKRDALVQLEARYGIRVLVARDDALIPPAFRLERLRAFEPAEAAVPLVAPLTQAPEPDEEEEEIEETEETLEAEQRDQESEDERARSRRRRRRRRRHEEEPATQATGRTAKPVEQLAVQPGGPDEGRAAFTDHGGDEEGDTEQQRRRRGRRGGRRRARREGGPEPAFEVPLSSSATVEILAASSTGELEPSVAGALTSLPEERGLESGIGAPRPASSTVEIVPASGIEVPGQGSAEVTASPPLVDGLQPAFGAPLPLPDAVEMPLTPSFAEKQPILADAIVLPLVEVAVEAASLPAPAGDLPSELHRIVPAGETEPPVAEPVEDVGEVPRFQTPYAGPVGLAATADRPEAVAAAIPHEPEQILETASPAPEPAAPVQTVSEKPVNPRRGWWQRLLQS